MCHIIDFSQQTIAYFSQIRTEKGHFPSLRHLNNLLSLTCTECHQTCSNEPLRMIYISGSSCLLENAARRYHTDTPCNNSNLNHYVIYKIHNLPKKYVYRKPEAMKDIGELY